MQLPAEIRLMVLRHLLAGNTPISTRQSYNNAHTVYNEEKIEQGSVTQSQNLNVSGYRFAPAIIITCQQLATEALPILYRENTLEINIATRWAHDPITYPLTRMNLYSNPGVRTNATILDNECILQHTGYGGWSRSKSRGKIFTRFQSFHITVDTSPEHSHINQLRHVLHLIAPVLLTSNVEVDVKARDSASIPIPIIPMNDQVSLAKPFILLRCSSFRFKNLTDPRTLAIQGIITSTQPAIDLEDFSRIPNDMLGLLIPAIWHDRAWYNEVAEIDTRFAEAIENFDVQAFLQVRFEIIRLWRRFTRKMKPENRQEEVFFFLEGWNHFDIHVSYRLGLKIKGEGDEFNARLVALKKRHNATLVFDPDTLRRIAWFQNRT